jgi:hypothetical protein
MLMGALSATVIKRSFTQDKVQALAGNWILQVKLEGDTGNPMSTPLSFQVTNNNLAGQVSVTNVLPKPNGPQPSGELTFPLSDLKFNGKSLSFTVNNAEDVMSAELEQVNDNLFEGKWKSPIDGRWKGSKKEFSGTIRIERIK